MTSSITSCSISRWKSHFSRCGRCLRKTWCSQECNELGWEASHKEFCSQEVEERKVTVFKGRPAWDEILEPGEEVHCCGPEALKAEVRKAVFRKAGEYSEEVFEY